MTPMVVGRRQARRGGTGRTGTRGRAWTIGSVVGFVVTSIVVPGSPAPRVDAAPDSSTPAALVAVAPCRLLDTRTDAALAVSTPRSVDVAGRCGVPSDATSVAVTVTAVDTAAAGWVSVWPSGAAWPGTSTLNVVAGETRANGAIVVLGADGDVQLMVSARMSVVVDVTGAFVPTEFATAGRFVATPPTRLIDTRGGAALPPGGTLSVPLPTGVPADAIAVAISIAAPEASSPGFLTAYPGPGGPPLASTLNVDAAGQTRATGAIVAVGPGGLRVFSQRGGHVVVDLAGWFTGESAGMSPSGLFVAMPPTRLLDTRAAARPGGDTVFPGGSITLPVTGLGAVTIGGGVAAVVGNWTMTGTWAGGYVTAYPALTRLPLAATVNADRRGQTVAQLGIVGASAAGVEVFASAGTHLVVDVTGWFTGAPAATELTQPATNTPVNDVGRRVLLVGDSTLAGVRWYQHSQQALRGSTFVLDAESCRRLSGVSCRGRENRVPDNAAEAIRARGGPFDVVVIMTGYNDWYTEFGRGFEQVVDAARRSGASEIVWLTYRERTDYRNPTGGASQLESFRAANADLRARVASGAWPDVTIAGWNAYTSSADSDAWFTSDGIHLTLAGSYGVADFISRTIAARHGEPCPGPSGTGGGSPCSLPGAGTALVDTLATYHADSNDVHCYEVGADRHVECRRDPKLH